MVLECLMGAMWPYFNHIFDLLEDNIQICTPSTTSILWIEFHVHVTMHACYFISIPSLNLV